MSSGLTHSIRDDGWATIDSLLGDAAVRSARDALDDLFAAEADIAVDRGWCTDVYRITYALPAKDPRFVEIATDPAVLALVRPVLGDDCVLAACNGIDLVPGGKAQRLHRDHPDPIDGTALFLHVVVALDDFTEDNGGTVLVPGSHRGRWVAGDPLPGPERVAVVPAGGAVIYDGSLVHGAGANRTVGRRRALHLFYARWWARPHWDLVADLAPEVEATLSVEQRRVLGADLRPRRFDPVTRRIVR